MVHLSPIFGVKKQNCRIVYDISNEGLELTFPRLYMFSKSIGPLSKIRNPDMTKNEHLCPICCRPEVGDGVISGENVTTLESYGLVNVEVASSIRFRSIITIVAL